MPTNRPTHVYCKGNSVEIGQSSTNGIGYPYAKNNFIPHFTRYTEINSKWVVSLNITTKIIIFLGEKSLLP